MNWNETPRKVDASEVEILDSRGKTIGNEERRSGIKVFKAGPALLLFLPLLIPIFILVFFLAGMGALLFGKTAFRVFSTGIRRR
jgi:hypothetical protein